MRFRPINLGHHFDVSARDLPHLLPETMASLRSLPSGRATLHGIPFQLGRRTGTRRWLRIDREIEIPIGAMASHLVLVQFAHPNAETPEAVRGDDPEPDFLEHVGEPVAQLTISWRDHETQEEEVRFGIETERAHGSLEPVVFRAVSHRRPAAVDWRGPHLAQNSPRFGEPGSSSNLSLPGTWGVNQSGAAYTDTATEARYWLLSLELRHAHEPIRCINIKPATDAEWWQLYVAGATLFTGTTDPLSYRARRTVRLAGRQATEVDLAVDLGVRGFARSPYPQPTDDGDQGGFVGWGPHPARSTSRELLIDVAASPDALLTVGKDVVPMSELHDTGYASAGGLRIEMLPPAEIPIEVTVRAADTGQVVPARVHLRTADGRYIPPLGHRREINPGFMEDCGSDLSLGGMPYAYVPGRFRAEVPAGDLYVEVVKGFEYRPMSRWVSIAPGRRDLEVQLERAFDSRPRGWVTADNHVHFLAPTSAVLQAQAEGLKSHLGAGDPMGRAVHEHQRRPPGSAGRLRNRNGGARWDREPDAHPRCFHPRGASDPATPSATES